MKKFLSLYMAVLITIFMLCLSACDQNLQLQKSTDEKMQDKVQDKVQDKISDYVTVKKTETEFGSISIPQISEKKLNSEDVKQANLLFGDIEQTILASVEETKSIMKENGDDMTDITPSPICETEIALNDDILSILVKYNEFIYYSPRMDMYKAINIDVKKDKVIPSKQIIEKAGFSENSVEESLWCYGDRCKYNEWERMTYFDFASDKTLPEGLGDPNPEWQEDLEQMIDKFNSEPEAEGKSWDALEIYPTVFYEGKKKLSVCAEIPTAAGAGFFNAMVKIGDSQEEVNEKNTHTPYGEEFGNYAMSTDAACIAVEKQLELDENGRNPENIKLNIEASSMDIFTIEEEVQPVYIIQVYEDGETDTVTHSRWAVGVFSGDIWQQDIATDKWNIVPNDKNILDIDIMAVGKSKNAIAAVYNNPNDYELWGEKVYANIDMIPSDSENFDADIENILLYAIEGDTTVSFDTGVMENGKFEIQSTDDTLNIKEGQCINIWLKRSADAKQAITVKNKNGTAIYVLDSLSGKDKAEYLVPSVKK